MLTPEGAGAAPATADAAEPRAAHGFPQRYRRSVVTTFGVAAGTALTTLLVTPFLIHHMGRAVFSVWILALTIVGYLELFEIGFGSVTTKAVAEDAGRRPERVIRTLNTSIAVLSALAVPALITGVIVAVVVPQALGIDAALAGQMRILIIVLTVSLAVSIPADTLGGALNAHQRYDLAGLINLFAIVATGVGTVLVVAFGGSLVPLAIVTAGVSIAAHPLRWLALRRLVPRLRLHPRLVDRRQIPRLAGMAGWMFVGGLFYSLAGTDLIVVSAVLGVTSVAVYAIALKLCQFILRAVEQLASAFMPHASSLHAAGDVEGLRALLIDGTRTTLALAAPCFLLLGLLAPEVIRIWVGSQYGAAAPVLSVLAGAGAIYCVVVPAELLVIGVGRARVWGLTSSVNALVSIVACVGFGLAFGLVGVALGDLVANGLVLLPLLMRSACRVSSCSPLDVVRYAIAPHLLPSAALAGLVVLLRPVTAQSTAGVVAASVLGLLVYAVLYVAFGASPAERRWLAGRLPRRLGGGLGRTA
jgi:O-antigen/teichoic acid export membrane protein